MVSLSIKTPFDIIYSYSEVSLKPWHTLTVLHQRGTWTHVKRTVHVPNRSGSVTERTTSRCGPECTKLNCTIPWWAPERKPVLAVPHWYAMCCIHESGAKRTKCTSEVRYPQKRLNACKANHPGTSQYGAVRFRRRLNTPLVNLFYNLHEMFDLQLRCFSYSFSIYSQYETLFHTKL